MWCYTKATQNICIYHLIIYRRFLHFLPLSISVSLPLFLFHLITPSHHKYLLHLNRFENHSKNYQYSRGAFHCKRIYYKFVKLLKMHHKLINCVSINTWHLYFVAHLLSRYSLFIHLYVINSHTLYRPFLFQIRSFIR